MSIKRSRIIALVFISTFLGILGVSSAETINYTYDAMGRMIRAEYDSGVVVQYTYDAMGNRLEETISGGTATGLPGAPQNVTATAGNAQATVSFTPPASDGGSPISSYTATSNPEGKSATKAASPITVPGLTNGTAYTFTVTATNANGTGAPGTSNSVTPSADLPNISVTPGQGTMGTTMTIAGSGFGTKKGKVYLEKAGVRYTTKVIEWNRGGTSNLIKVSVNKAIPAGGYKVVLVSKVLGEISVENAFEVMAPRIDSVLVAMPNGKPLAMIQGDYLGYPKKTEGVLE